MIKMREILFLGHNASQRGKTSKNTVCGTLGCVATIKLNRGPAGRFSETDLPYPTPIDDVLLHLKHLKKKTVSQLDRIQISPPPG